MPNLNQILILEADKHFAAALTQTLGEIGRFTITTVSTVKEACLLLTQHKQTLAFIPVTEGAKIIRSLRAIQPDLRLILTTPSAEITIPESYSGQVQGVLLKPQLHIDLQAVLQKALNLPLHLEIEPSTNPGTKPALDTAVLITVLQRAKLEQLIQTAVFALGSQLLAYWGNLSESEASIVALQVGQDWPPGSQTARLQYIHLPARAGEWLLYTQYLVGGYLLTLVALPETPLTPLRHQAERLLPALTDVINGRIPPPPSTEPSTPLYHKSYALAWRPIQPLPETFLIPLRRTIERLAATNQCTLSFISIEPHLTHLVVACPPGRDSVWAAYLFKNGSEEIIQREYGGSTTLWEPGFYAITSTEPLSEAELHILQERDTTK